MRHFRAMSTITAILEPDADGSLHLPLPAEFKHGKIKVVASLTAVAGSDETPARTGLAREWAKRARGSVRLAAGESVDAARRAYYAGKYGVQP
jgi:hypothetical protein